MKETELAEKIIEHYADWEIYKEVPCAGIIDIYCTKGSITVAIECKVSLSLSVMEQAHKNVNYAHYSYAATPYRKGGLHFEKQLFAHLGIGLLMYDERVDVNQARFVKHNPGEEMVPAVHEYIKPRLFRKPRIPQLEEFMKQSQAGSQNNRITFFKNTVNEISALLERRGQMPIVDVIKATNHHYSSNSSAKQCIIEMCRRGVIKEFKFEKGNLISNTQ